MKYLFPAIIVLVALLGCQSEQSTITLNQSESVDSIFREFFAFKQRINPIEATKAGESKYNHQVANYISDSYQQDLIENYGNFLEAITSIDSTQVSSAQWLSLQVMKWDCTIKMDGLTNEIVTISSPMYDLPSSELMPIKQIQSLHLYMAQLAGGTSVQPFNTLEDYDNWLKRVDDLIVFLETCIEKMSEGMSTGVVLPKVLVERMVPQIEGFINDPVKTHLFYKPIGMMPDSFSAEEKDKLSKAYSEMITNKLAPKFQELKSFLLDQYLPEARDTHGFLDLPNGVKTYDYLIRLHTTTNMTADEIHELGKSEVKRISTEMEKIKTELGFEGDLRAFFDHIRASEEQMPFTQPEEVITNFSEIRKVVEANLDQVFGLKPKTDFNIIRTEAFREASAAAEYVPGSKDASRSGIFYVPIPDAKSYNKFSDEALFLHEAIPGHHYQLSLQQENQNLPEFLHPESMGVFVEGWALYAESLGKELGLYEDPIQYFGMLSMEMHRAIRLVVDTGIHSKGWTREDAIQYSLDNEAEDEASIIAEIERYMGNPGQALSYKMGQLKIRELRTKAEQALGNEFDVREYHNQVLNSGSLPLILLEQKIERWIKSELEAS